MSIFSLPQIIWGKLKILVHFRFLGPSFVACIDGEAAASAASGATMSWADQWCRSQCLSVSVSAQDAFPGVF